MANPLISNLQLSLSHRLHHILLQVGYFTEHLQQPLTKASVDTSLYDHATRWTYEYAACPHGWVHIDANGNVEPGNVAVFVGGILQSPSAYAVDYVHGWVIFPSDPGGSVTASFSRWNAGIRRGFPTDKDLEVVSLPMLVFEVNGEAGRPFGVHGGAEFLSYRITIDILGDHERVAVELGSYIRKMLQRLPVYDFNVHQTLGYGGVLDTGFNAATQMIHYASFLQKPSMNIVRPRTGDHQKLRHRAMVYAEIEFVG